MCPKLHLHSTALACVIGGPCITQCHRWHLHNTATNGCVIGGTCIAQLLMDVS